MIAGVIGCDGKEPRRKRAAWIVSHELVVSFHKDILGKFDDHGLTGNVTPKKPKERAFERPDDGFEVCCKFFGLCPVFIGPIHECWSMRRYARLSKR